MKLVTYLDDAEARRIGALADGETRIVDLATGAEALGHDALPHFADMLALIDGGEAALALARTVVGAAPATRPLAGTTLLAPLPEPRQMRDAMMFEKHVRQARGVRYRRLAAQADDPAAAWREFEEQGVMDPPAVWYEQPIYYKCNRFSVIGTGADVIWPSFAELMDYELELGIVIGKGGVNIPAEGARGHIFGYTIFNDVSARDTQLREMRGQLGPAKGKDFDTGNVIGPWLVTADEIADPYDLTMVARINGEELSRGSSADMHHKFEDIIAWISRDETLHAGEFIGSGTVGDGCGLEHDRFLSPGDVMELEITGLGVLTNRLVRPA